MWPHGDHLYDGFIRLYSVLDGGALRLLVKRGVWRGRPRVRRGRRTRPADVVRPPIADLRGPRNLIVSPDGTGIGFACQYSGQPAARFSIIERRLETAPAGGLQWLPAVTEDGGLRVSDWAGGTAPKLNGVALNLAPHEISFSAALAPDRNSVVLGSEFPLRLFDRNGVERRRDADGGLTWAVNVSADGKLAIAAHADGTIRGNRMSDGRELLAFFPLADRKGWVCGDPLPPRRDRADTADRR